MLLSSKTVAPAAVALTLLAVLTAPAAAASPESAAAACENLVSVQLANVTVSAAVPVTSGSFLPPGAQNALTNLPPFCRVTGVMTPTADSRIRFEMWLPLEKWNGRFTGVGNGGWAGVISYQALAVQVRRLNAGIANDLGHEAGPGLDAAKFAFGHPEKLVDFAWRADHEATALGKALAREMYGKPAGRSYWVGCSTGGREALMQAQKFPGDYDGIIAGAPANNWTTMMASGVATSLAASLPPEHTIARAKLRVLTAGANAACDALDGVSDGVIDDPRKCAFDPATLACKVDQDPATCLTAGEAEVARLMYAGFKDPVTGKTLFPGLMPASEAGWTAFINPTGPFSIPVSHFKWLVFADSAWDWKTFDFGKPSDRDAWLKGDAKYAPLLNSTSPDLRAFRQRGGKLLQWHGWADQLISPQNSIDYFESVLAFFEGRGQDRGAALRDVGSFYRMFMAPGVAHCAGGPGPNEADFQTALEKWVEESTAPETIVARHVTNQVVDRTRPLCAYPKVAVWKGSGDTNDAANFTCRDP